MILVCLHDSFPTEVNRAPLRMSPLTRFVRVSLKMWLMRVRRRIIEMLNVQATLTIEDNQKGAYVHCT